MADQEWEEYKKKFNKSYTDEADEKMRRARYFDAKAKMEEHNRKYESGEVTWKMGVNHLFDETEEEFGMRCGKKTNPPK